MQQYFQSGGIEGGFPLKHLVIRFIEIALLHLEVFTAYDKNQSRKCDDGGCRWDREHVSNAANFFETVSGIYLASLLLLNQWVKS